MRIFAIMDESLPEQGALGYLICYERARCFYIELPGEADPWQTPLLLSSFARRGQYTVDSYWSRMWVEQRIVPRDRQNIGQVLRANGLEEYDEFQLLTLARGRCAQDDCYLEEVSPLSLPGWLTQRWKTRVEEVVPLAHRRLLVFFRNGEARIVDVGAMEGEHPELGPWLAREERFCTAEVQTDGYGVMWSERAGLLHPELYSSGKPVPLERGDLPGFVRHRVVSASQACRILNCSRQNIDDLIRRGKLHPIRSDVKYKLFLRSEVLHYSRCHAEQSADVRTGSEGSAQ